MITVILWSNINTTVLYSDWEKWLLHHYYDTAKTLKVLFIQPLTSARASTGGIRLDRESSISISAEAAALLDRDKNLRYGLRGLISANTIVVYYASGLISCAVGIENAGTLAGCEV